MGCAHRVDNDDIPVRYKSELCAHTHVSNKLLHMSGSPGLVPKRAEVGLRVRDAHAVLLRQGLGR